MTLEHMGFVKEIIYDKVLFKRESIVGTHYICIEFNLKYKEIEFTNIDTIDMMLLNAIYIKVKELFEGWQKNERI